MHFYYSKIVLAVSKHIATITGLRFFIFRNIYWGEYKYACSLIVPVVGYQVDSNELFKSELTWIVLSKRASESILSRSPKMRWTLTGPLSIPAGIASSVAKTSSSANRSSVQKSGKLSAVTTSVIFAMFNAV